jgi:macrolide-specific efflux system membrane fusion protein
MDTLSDAPESKALPASPEEPVPAKGAYEKFKSVVKRRSVWVVGAALLLVAGVLGYRWAFGEAKVVYVTVAVERGDLESTVVAAGLVQPFKYVDVGAQTSGKLKTLKVIRGDQVIADQLLAEIDPILADTALLAANAAQRNMTSQRAVKQAQLVLTQAERTRNDKLYAEQLISTNARDVSRANYDAAFAEVAAVSAQMKQASAVVDTAKANLGYTKITAPMAGEVVSISLLEGQTLNANQSAPNILRIADISTVTVWAQVSEADIVRVKAGQEVYFTVLGAARRWTGKIRQVLPTPELINNVVFYDVLFDIPNPGRELKIQMTAQVFIVLAQVKGVLLVPTAAIGNAAEGSEVEVKVLKADGSLEFRTIKVGLKSELLAEVQSGLQEKERVVVREITAKGSSKSALTSKRGR